MFRCQQLVMSFYTRTRREEPLWKSAVFQGSLSVSHFSLLWVGHRARDCLTPFLRDSLAQGPLSVTGYHQNCHSTIRVVLIQQLVSVMLCEVQCSGRFFSLLCGNIYGSCQPNFNSKNYLSCPRFTVCTWGPLGVNFRLRTRCTCKPINFGVVWTVESESGGGLNSGVLVDVFLRSEGASNDLVSYGCVRKTKGSLRHLVFIRRRHH